MPDRLYDYLRNNYMAYPLGLTTPQCIPGMLLDCCWRPNWPGAPEKPEFRRLDGWAWDFIGQTEADYPSEMTGARVLQKSIAQKIELEAGAALPQFGIGSTGRLTKDVSALLTVHGVKARLFVRGPAPIDLCAALRELEHRRPEYWKWVRDDFLITESFYVTELEFEFRLAGLAEVREEITRSGFQAVGHMQGSWVNETTYRVVGDAEAPVAVRGIRV